jgi:flagellar biosynthesis anti-sigma factor FlgM
MPPVNPAGPSLQPDIPTAPRSGAASASSSLAATQTVSAASPEAGAALLQSGQDTAIVSPSGLIGKQLLDTARKSSGVNASLVNRLTQEIASGTYNPPASAIADALVRTEQKFIGGS